MSKFLFCNAAYSGHVNPTLPIVRELISRGAEVTYYCTDTFKEVIELTDANFQSYKDPWTSPDFASSLYKEFTKIASINAHYFILQQVLQNARAQQADYLIYESMCLWGKVLARILNIPAISLHTSLAINKNYTPFNPYTKNLRLEQENPDLCSSINIFCEKCNIQPFDYDTFFFHEELLNIVLVPYEFHPALETFDDTFEFVGPVMANRQEDHDFPLDRLREQQSVYVSLGTVVSGVTALYDICLTAFGNQPQPLIMAIGGKIDRAVFGPLPHNVMLHSYVPQLEVLQHADIFINHAGTNSVMEALYYGVPQILFPITLEQQTIAKRVQELKLGIVFHDPGTVTAYTLRKAVEHLKGDTEIITNIRAMSERMQETGGYKRIADILLQFH